MAESENITAQTEGSYSVEVVPPEQDGYGAAYRVELVRRSTGADGLDHQQRLPLAEYPAAGSAEEHQREAEAAIERDGIDALGSDAQRVAQLPYQDGQYLAVVFPTDGSAGDGAKLHLLHLNGAQVSTALVANGSTVEMDALCDRLDQVWALGGNGRLLDEAQHEAAVRGHLAPGDALFAPDTAAPAVEVESPLWRFDTLPVNDPAGQPLGHALHMVVYPTLAHDPDGVGIPAAAGDRPVQMIEMAHFPTEKQAQAFIADFTGYLIPGVVEGPDLAVEVARLEGLPGQWQTVQGDELRAYQNDQLSLVRGPADWHPYNPHAERDARVAAEGLYYDPIQRHAQPDRLDEPALEL